ncbi:type 2 isopentenyl-diphosphate Delta-isomerase [Thermoflavimicrobium daqui]|uniref:Isopentenyl-diphosphate delta-isomerase n=1 Tax=Thermoflavimicrobium daqui TaxID=2137476 RepID=A0A364K5L5_9BACL|nr:type 2 isopentenyl-diphosphate Delta-isomerase [Thermoflavimicrobium daqui]RAL25601.1 type 2 isopentenyl-diphosphate Delta-isomerase [Thermoflavimicrobium daqui]
MRLISREQRKLDHLKFALQSNQEVRSAFDDIQLVHRSLPEVNLSDCKLQTSLGGKELASPLLINAMTGGAYKTEEINYRLALVAKETGLSMAVGSQKAALNNPDLARTYQVIRQANPNGVVLANLSADSSIEEAKQAIAMIHADFLQLHLNVPQELVMPEGDRYFTGLMKKIQQIVSFSPVPVIVKEVGFGMCKETYEQLLSVGVKLIDVAGRGGTNFIWVENQRREGQEYHFLYRWGQSTVISLIEAQKFHPQMELISSGGIRNPLDMIKSFVLGAKVIGMASPILRSVQEEGVETTIQTIHRWHEQLRILMTMLGAKCLSELQRVPAVILGETREWCESRGLDHYHYSRRF